MPLGVAVGNALEVIECLEILKGGGSPDLVECSLELTTRMLLLGKVAADRGDAERKVRAALDSGAALERFRQIIEGQGGDPQVVDDYTRLPAAPSRHLLRADRAGYVTRIDAEPIGRASVALGAGRDRVDDAVDPAVGIVITAKPGAEVRPGEPILELHYRDQAKLDAALALAARAIIVGDEAPRPRPLILGHVH
jgi:thymidine phosphorylase